jgi:sugar O-acyltransferase (sialic acid O-acetyltransferase NeuD family)
MSSVVMFGTGRIADLMTYYLRHDSPHKIVAYTQDGSYISSPTHQGLPIVAFEEVAQSYPPDEVEILVAVSFKHVNQLRADRFREARSMGYRLLSYVSSRAITWPDLELGQNSVVMEGSVVQPNVVLGDDVTVGPSCCIGHDTIIMDHAYLASHVTVSGHVTVRPYVFMGAAATIRDGLTIGERGVIGANAMIQRDTEPAAVYASPRAQLLPLPSDKLPRI